MTETFPTILLTRPQEQSGRFASELRRRIPPEVPILVSPILEIRTLPSPDPEERPGFLVLTSAHAAEAIADTPEFAGVKAYCVGEATADAARLAGAESIAAGGTAADLVTRLKEDAPPGPGHYLRGRHVSFDLEEVLAKEGISVTSSVVYDQVALPLTDQARASLEVPGAVLLPLFSARSARLLAEECRDATARLSVVAMSHQVAQQWPEGKEVIAVASAPSAEAMAEAVAACLRG